MNSGCYDGCVYCLRTDNGSVHWSLQLSPEPVKSSACVDPASGAMWVGSHDQHLYSIDVEVYPVIQHVYINHQFRGQKSHAQVRYIC